MRGWNITCALEGVMKGKKCKHMKREERRSEEVYEKDRKQMKRGDQTP